MPKVNSLTQKMKNFCHEYMSNGGNVTQAYLTAYDTESETTASREGSLLLQRDDITEYIRTLNKPIENRITNEREKKRAIIWEEIEHAREQQDHTAIARYMDILNKMDAEYININRNIDDTHEKLDTLDIDTLKSIVQPPQGA